MKKGVFFLVFSLFLLSQVLGYEIVCTDGLRGVRVWNHEQNFNESGWTLQDLENEEGLNCTLIETSINLTECKQYEPIIDQLNQNLKDKTEIIERQEKIINRQKFYKWFAIIFIATTIILIIWLKLSSKDKNNGNKRKTENR